jgi:hypothetical protein
MDIPRNRRAVMRKVRNLRMRGFSYLRWGKKEVAENEAIVMPQSAAQEHQSAEGFGDLLLRRRANAL